MEVEEDTASESECSDDSLVYVDIDKEYEGDSNNVLTEPQVQVTKPDELSVKLLGLDVIVRDRTAGAMMNIQKMDGESYLYVLVLFSLMFFLVGVLTSVYIGIDRSNTNELPPNLIFFDIAVRCFSAICFTVLIVWQTRFLWLATDPLEIQVLVVICGWCAWLIPPLNPAVVAVEIVAAVQTNIANSSSVDTTSFFNYYPRARYASVANSLFVAATFYLNIYFSKWLRLEAIRTDHMLRRKLANAQPNAEHLVNEETSYYRIRSLKGIVPMMVLTYVVFRIALCEALGFDMGFVPSVAWISVVRFCTGSDSAQCQAQLDQARAGVTCVFCVWEMILLTWLLWELWKARSVLRLYYFLQSRSYIVAFEVTSWLSCFYLVTLLLWGLFLVCLTDENYLADNNMENTGVFLGSGMLSLAVVLWFAALFYMFRNVTQMKKRNYRYIDRFDELPEVNFDEEQAAEKLGAGNHLFELTYNSRALPNWLNEGDMAYFCLEFAILMWNLSYTTFLLGTSKHPQSDDDVMLLVEDARFSLVDQTTDDLGGCCLVLESDDMIVVAFRGTLIMPTELADSHKLVSTDNNSKVHSGMFYAFNQTLRLRVRASVEKAMELHERPVFLTGHGVGGCYATFMADDLARGKVGTARSVYTFGAPPCCDTKYRKQLSSLVKDHFDITNVNDKLHALRLTEWMAVSALSRCGVLVMLDSIGNIVVQPDWLEASLMMKSKRVKFDAHVPSSYTWSLVQWSQRVYMATQTQVPTSLWTPCLHNIKQLIRSDRQESWQVVSPKWQTTLVKQYLERSSVGLGTYRDGTCLQLRILRITGLHAKRVLCILSCGTMGVASSFWEVQKTGIAHLQERGDLNELEKTDLKAGHKGVDAEALSKLRARFAEFKDDASVEFGVYQLLRPCASIMIKAVDVNHGNSTFGTICVPVTKLLPLPSQGKSAKSFSFELTGRNDGDLKIDFEVVDVGKVTLESLVHDRTRSSTLLTRADYYIDYDESNQPKITYDADMATYYMRRNVNIRSQRVAIRICLMTAALRGVDLKRGRFHDAKEIVGLLKLDTEKGRTEAGVIKGNICEWQCACFTFGNMKTLTGFETLVVQLFAKWDDEDEDLIGEINIKTSVVVSKYHDNNILVEWLPFEPVPVFTQDSWAVQLPGNVCMGFELLIQSNKLMQHSSSRPDTGDFIDNPSPQASPRRDPFISPPSGSNVTPSVMRLNKMVRQASGSLMSLINPRFSGFGSGGSAASSSEQHRGHWNSPETPHHRHSLQPVPRPPCWDTLVVRPFDERVMRIQLRVEGASGLDVLDMDAVKKHHVDPYCEVSLVDPLTQKLLQKKRTGVIRGNATPLWEEDFSFGQEWDSPVIGNEIVCFKVCGWDPTLPEPQFFGQYRIPVSQVTSDVDEIQEVRLQGGLSIDPWLRFKIQISRGSKPRELSLSKSPVL